MTDRLTLATSTGLPFLSLAFHVATGLVAIGAGFVAVVARKGGVWHRRAGVAFVWAMIATGIVVIGIAAYEGKQNSIGGAFAAYLVFTGFIAVKPLRRARRQIEIVLTAVAFSLAGVGYTRAFAALERPGNQLDGVPAGMLFFMSTVILLAAIGDVRMVAADGLQGARRLARHLWRMCFGLFIASGSFFLGQMRFVPAPVRSLPLMLVLALSPLAILLYWMWRVRLRGNLRRMVVSAPIEGH